MNTENKTTPTMAADSVDPAPDQSAEATSPGSNPSDQPADRSAEAPSEAAAAPASPSEIDTAPAAQEPTPAAQERAPVRPDPPSSPREKKKPKKKKEKAEVDDFDPAADLPTYREGMNWFVLRVASNKEKSVRETLLRKVQIEGLDIRVGRIMVPTEKTKTFKSGKARVQETKLYPGYVFVEMKLEDDGRIPQDVFFLIKETTGVGDFVGTAGRPTPMKEHEAEKMLFDSRKPDETPVVKMEFKQGDNVKINEGPFANYDGTVDELLPDKGRVRVLVSIFGRQAPVELEYWQISSVEE